MFGFIRPVKPELRVKDAERFEQVYCGLCHAIRALYGRFYTFFLSYDMTFLVLVLGCDCKDIPPPCRRRCAAHPFARRPCAPADWATQTAAGLSVLLCYHKLQDSVADEKGPKRLFALLLCRLGRRGYRRAKTRFPAADAEMCRCLGELQTLEKENCPSMDRAADASARLTVAVVPHSGDTRERILRQMFYHIGRWLYLLDAVQDVGEDLASGNYNPIVRRYSLKTAELTSIRQPLTRTLERSLVDVCTAFDLLDKQRDAELIRNIIFLGMPTVTRQVLEGTYRMKGWGKHGSL